MTIFMNSLDLITLSTFVNVSSYEVVVLPNRGLYVILKTSLLNYGKPHAILTRLVEPFSLWSKEVRTLSVSRNYSQKRVPYLIVVNISDYFRRLNNNNFQKSCYLFGRYHPVHISVEHPTLFVKSFS